MKSPKQELKETLGKLGIACALEYKKTGENEFALVSGLITTILQVWDMDPAGLEELVQAVKDHCRSKLSEEGKKRVAAIEQNIARAKKAGLN